MNMKQLRERVNKRPEQIAVDLDVTLSTVRNWESGRHEPRLLISEIPKFLAVYQCTLEEAIDAAKASHQKYQSSQ
jgi:putative transcriptional regulator